MTSTPSLSLRDRLLAAAQSWSAATGRSLGALSSVVVDDGKTFARLADPARGVTDATLEKFAAFLADPANWPEGQVATEAVALAHVTGVGGVFHAQPCAEREAHDHVQS